MSLRHDGDCIVLRNVNETTLEIQQDWLLLVLLVAVYVDRYTLLSIELDHQSLLGNREFHKLTPPRKVLAAIGITARNSLDKLTASRVLLELEGLNLLVWTGAPEAHGVFRDGAFRVMQQKATPGGRVVTQVAARRSILVVGEFSRGWGRRHDGRAGWWWLWLVVCSLLTVLFGGCGFDGKPCSALRVGHPFLVIARTGVKFPDVRAPDTEYPEVQRKREKLLISHKLSLCVA